MARMPLKVEWVIKVWWVYVVVVLLLVAGIYAFLQVVGFGPGC